MVEYRSLCELQQPSGRWGTPQNLGNEINTDGLECCLWVSDDQKIIIYTHETLSGKSPASATYLAVRSGINSPWQDRQQLSGDVGNYLADKGIHDFHMTPQGNLYSWTEKNQGTLYFSQVVKAFKWQDSKPMAKYLQSTKKETQPWVNNSETVLYYNRRGNDGNSELMRSTRTNLQSRWSRPTRIKLIGFADPNGLSIWGEPSFTKDGTMYFVRFNTITKDWICELMKAPRNSDGSFGPPVMLEFE